MLSVSVDHEKDRTSTDRARKDDIRPDVEIKAEDRLTKGGKLRADVEADLFQRYDSSHKSTKDGKTIMLLQYIRLHNIL